MCCVNVGIAVQLSTGTPEAPLESPLKNSINSHKDSMNMLPPWELTETSDL